MKKKIIYLTEFLFLIYIVMFNNFVVGNFLKYLNVINILLFGILSLIVYFAIGFPRNKKLINYNVMQTIIIDFIVYYILIYVLGLFFGFVSNIYSLKFINIFKNVIYVVIYYYFRGIYRYIVIKQSNDKKKISCIIITILFILLDVIMEINSYDLNTGIGMFKLICSSIIPNISINMLISYISYNFNFKNSILVMIFLKLFNYILPIFPDLGDYLSSVLLIILIFILYYQFSLMLEKYDRNINVRIRKNNRYVFIFILSFMFILVGVVSGMFKYQLLAIVSNSMIPEFSRGDAVLVEKLKYKELYKLKIDDIIAFYDPSDRMVIHRIVSIDENDGDFLIKTMGDNNESIDSWTISNDDVYGRVIISFKYIGIPSIELSEVINR